MAHLALFLFARDAWEARVKSAPLSLSFCINFFFFRCIFFSAVYHICSCFQVASITCYDLYLYCDKGIQVSRVAGFNEVALMLLLQPLSKNISRKAKDVSEGHLTAYLFLSLSLSIQWYMAVFSPSRFPSSL